MLTLVHSKCLFQIDEIFADKLGYESVELKSTRYSNRYSNFRNCLFWTYILDGIHPDFYSARLEEHGKTSLQCPTLWTREFSGCRSKTFLTLRSAMFLIVISLFFQSWCVIQSTNNNCRNSYFHWELNKISRCFRARFVRLLQKRPKSHGLSYTTGDTMVTG